MQLSIYKLNYFLTLFSLKALFMRVLWGGLNHFNDYTISLFALAFICGVLLCSLESLET